MLLPAFVPTSTEISLITGKTEIYVATTSGSSTNYILTGYETHYYLIPFFIWVAIAVPTIFFLGRFIKELVKRL